jgi:hypothetical protein
MAKLVKYNGQAYTFPDNTSGKQALDAMKVMFPELENGSFSEAGDTITVFVVAQNKSAKLVKYNGQAYTFPDNTSGKQALDAMKVMFPELENGSFSEAGDTITVFVVAQNKSLLAA